MNIRKLEQLLKKVKSGETSIEEATGPVEVPSF